MIAASSSLGVQVDGDDSWSLHLDGFLEFLGQHSDLRLSLEAFQPSCMIHYFDRDVSVQYAAIAIGATFRYSGGYIDAPSGMKFLSIAS